MTTLPLTRVRVTLLAGVLALGVVAPLSAVSAASRPTSGSLKIQLNGLEPGAKVSVLVAGPHYRHVVTGPATLRTLRPGRYTLTPHSVKQSNGVEHAGPRAVITITRARTGVAHLAYFFIPTTTITIPQVTTLSVTGPVTGSQVVTLAGHWTLTNSDVIVSTPIPDRLSGYLLKVTGVSYQNSQTIVQAVPATLPEAVPYGSLDLTKVFSELNAIGSVASASTQSKTAHMTSMSIGSQDNICSGSTGFFVTPSISFGNFDTHTGFSWHGPYLSSQFVATASVTVSAASTVSCTIPDVENGGIPIFGGPGEPIPVDIGIPLILIPSLSVDLVGSASAGGQMSATLSASAQVTLGADLATGVHVPNVDIQPFTFTNTSGVSANVSLSLVATAGIEVDGAVGVSIDAGPQVTLNVDSSATPWWSLEACLTGGITGNAFGFTIGSPTEINAICKTLDEASVGSTAPTTTTTLPGPTTTTTTAPPVAPPLPDYLSQVAYGNGRFVALGAQNGVTGLTNVIAHSTDGVNWYATKVPSHPWSDITFGNGVFVATISQLQGSGTSMAAVSSDGIHWKLYALPLGSQLNYGPVTFGGGRFEAVAFTSYDSAYSNNGINWTFSHLSIGADWQDVTYGDGKFVTISTTGNTSHTGDVVGYSTNGSTWKFATIPYNSSWRAVTYGGGKFVAVGGYGSNSVAYSSDGLHWIMGSIGAGWWADVTYGNGRFVAVGDYPFAAAAYSTDGISWSGAGMPGNNSSWSGVTYGNGVFAAVQSGPVGFFGSVGGPVALSTSGANWTSEGSVS